MRRDQRGGQPASPTPGDASVCKPPIWAQGDAGLLHCVQEELEWERETKNAGSSWPNVGKWPNNLASS